MSKEDSTRICGRSTESFLEEVERFHGFRAPGLVLGGFMVDWARERIGHETEADAIVETRHCLPDAIQLLTPCTVGNGWLKILDWDKFALSLYDRRSRCGYRVSLDIEKARSHPAVYDWFLRRVPKKSLPLERLLEAILAAGRSVLSCRAVEVVRFGTRIKKGPLACCPVCGEAYTTTHGPCCPACRGEAYFQPL